MTSSSSVKPTVILGLGIIGLLIGFILVQIYAKYFVNHELNQTSQDTEEFTLPTLPSPSPTPTPKPLPSGPQTYTFSHGGLVTGPKPSSATITPLDPELGDTQSLTVTVSHTSPVSSASLTLLTDNDSRTFPLSLSSGTPTEGVWQASWETQDSYLQRYQIQLSFQAGEEVFNGGLSFR